MNEYFHIALEIVSIAAGFYAWNRGAKELRILTLFLVIGFVIGIIMAALASRSINNLWLMHIFTPIQFTALFWLFSYWSSPKVKHLLLISIPVFVTFWGGMLIFFESFTLFSSYTRPVAALILIATSGYLLSQLLKDEQGSIFRIPKFWVLSGTLVYFSGMILLYALSNFLLERSADTLLALWVPIQTTANTVSTLMYIAGFLCLSPRLRPQT